MLKFFFWILLLANAALFAYREGAFETLLPSGHEPGRMSRQLNADKIRLVPASEANAPSAPVPAPAAAPNAAPAAPAPTTTPGTTTGAAPAADAAAVQKPVALACAEIGNFNAEEAKRFSARLASLSLGDRVSQHAVQEVATHIVYIPPQGDREGAEKKAGELRRLGITDFFIIQDNSNLRWGISLGVFKLEEAARAHLAALNQKGVHSARIGERSVTSNLVAFRLRGLDADARSALEKIRSGFPRQEMRGCDGA